MSIDSRAQLIPGFNPEGGNLVDSFSPLSPKKFIESFHNLARRIKLPNLDPVRRAGSSLLHKAIEFDQRHPVWSGLIYVTGFINTVAALSYLDPTFINRSPVLETFAATTTFGTLAGLALGVSTSYSRNN